MIKLFNKITAVGIKRTILALIAVFCYFYALYASDFAELHIKIPFLNFPIFIGEILLFICLFLLAVYCCKFSLKPDFRMSLVLSGYSLWVLTKAFLGYQTGGALALRNAALFYYPLFAVIGYMIFTPDLAIRKSWLLLIFIFLNLFFIPVNETCIVAFILLALGISLHLKQRNFRFIGISLCVFYIFYSRILWWNGRSHMVGMGVMFVFLAGYFLFGLAKVRLRTKGLAIIVLMIFFAVFLFKFGDQNALKSMLTISDLRQQYHDLDTEIEMKKKWYVQKPFPVRIYHENQKVEQVEFGAVHYVNGTAAQSLLPGEVNERKMIASVDHYIQRESEINAVGTQESPTMPVKTEKSVTQKIEHLRQRNRKELRENIHGMMQAMDEKTPSHIRASLTNVSAALESDEKSGDEGSQKKSAETLQISLAALKGQILKDENTVRPVQRLKSNDRQLDMAYANIFFRLFIWRDMINELICRRAWWGVSFGWPQRSSSMEILGWATVEWERDGWITPHNSFLHMIYRGGVFGAGCVVAIIVVLISMTKRFLRHRSVWGGLLVACLVYWVGVSNFLVFLELPYNAIPFWTFFGMTLAYLHKLENGVIMEKSYEEK